MDLEENTIHVASTQNNPSNLQEDNQHFEKVTVDGKQKAECHLCRSLLSGESNHGTTHLHDHLRSCKKRKQPDIRERLLADNSKSNLSKPFTSDNNATIFDDYDTDGEGDGKGVFG
ncbi:zinc finger BED domain-containing protein RICESLEEPER 2-like protein, partial [Tanacetum coccineum]